MTLNRRDATKLLGASAVLAAGCTELADGDSAELVAGATVEPRQRAEGLRVLVQLEEDVGEGKVRSVIVTAPYKDHRVRCFPGDVVTWVIANATTLDLAVGVAHFRAPARWARIHEPRELPFES